MDTSISYSASVFISHKRVDKNNVIEDKLKHKVPSVKHIMRKSVNLKR